MSCHDQIIFIDLFYLYIFYGHDEAFTKLLIAIDDYIAGDMVATSTCNRGTRVNSDIDHHRSSSDVIRPRP